MPNRLRVALGPYQNPGHCTTRQIYLLGQGTPRYPTPTKRGQRRTRQRTASPNHTPGDCPQPNNYAIWTATATNIKARPTRGQTLLPEETTHRAASECWTYGQYTLNHQRRPTIITTRPACITKMTLQQDLPTSEPLDVMHFGHNQLIQGLNYYQGLSQPTGNNGRC